MVEGSQRPRRSSHAALLRAQRVVTVLAVLALLGTALGTFVAAASASNAARRELNAQGGAVASAVVETFRTANSRLLSLRALFETDEVVDAERFERFVDRIGLVPGMIGLGRVERITAGELARWRADHPETPPFQLGDDGHKLPLGDRAVYYLADLGTPASELGDNIGVDLGVYPDIVAAIEMTLARDVLGATDSVSLGDSEATSVLLMAPISSERSEGLIMGWIDLDAMLGDRLYDGLADLVDWSVTDVTDGAEPADWADWSATVALDDRLWRIDVVSTTVEQVWTVERILGAFAGVLVAIVLALIAFLLGRGAEARLELDRMEFLAEQKDQLLADVSHELRTPLPVVLEPVDVVSRTREIIARRGRPLDVRYSGPASLVADGDPLRIGQIVRNLVDNAARHGEPPIHINFQSDGECATVQVADAGRGIPECCREEVFVRGLARDHDHPGPTSASNGLGLAASRYLARRMAGDLTLLEDGKTFVLSLPLVARGAELTSVGTPPN
jgi:signal transduction histidine kinase